MTRVYLLTEGDHADYRIVGAFSTEEKAVAAVAKFPDSRVEVFEVDELADHVEGDVWSVYVSRETGKLQPYNGSVRRIRHPTRVVVQPFKTGDVIESPISLQHAAATATEMHREWLRSQ